MYYHIYTEGFGHPPIPPLQFIILNYFPPFYHIADVFSHLHQRFWPTIPTAQRGCESTGLELQNVTDLADPSVRTSSQAKNDQKGTNFQSGVKAHFSVCQCKIFEISRLCTGPVLQVSSHFLSFAWFLSLTLGLGTVWWKYLLGTDPKKWNLFFTIVKQSFGFHTDFEHFRINVSLLWKTSWMHGFSISASGFKTD